MKGGGGGVKGFCFKCPERSLHATVTRLLPRQYRLVYHCAALWKILVLLSHFEPFYSI